MRSTFSKLQPQTNEEGFSLGELTIAAILFIVVISMASSSLITSLGSTSSYHVREGVVTTSSLVLRIAANNPQLEVINIRSEGCEGEPIRQEGFDISVHPNVCVTVTGSPDHFIIEGSQMINGELYTSNYDSFAS